jgi:HSP20 family protein
VKATAGVKRPARSFPFLYAIHVSDRRKPEVEEEAEAGEADFEDAAHGYDCLMRSRKDMDRLKLEMEELFADLCQVPRLVASRRGFRPAVDVYRTEDPRAVVVVVELAGVDPAATELVLADGVLVIRGLRRRSAGEQRVVHMEIDYGPFERQIPIAEPVDAEAAEATYSRGLLVVTFPVAERPTRRLTVQITTRGSA